jgi:hypothetical protein
MSVDDLQLRYGFNSLLREEADAVLKQPVFRRSPVLSKLLRYPRVSRWCACARRWKAIMRNTAR